MPEIGGKSFEIYDRFVWKSMQEIAGNVCQKSLENRWKSMPEIIGKSLEIYARNRLKIF